MKRYRHYGRKSRKRWWYALLLLLVIIGYGYWTIRRPLPPLKPVTAVLKVPVPTPAAKLNWPAVGQSAVGIVGSSVLTTHGTQTPVPTASTAKLITALTVLHVKPLTAGEQGPTITLTANDVALYNMYLAEDGSLVKVQAGEQLSEYQMLEAMLLPSANNMADSLAIWAFGSLPAYSNFANSYVRQLGLTDTHIGSDASGFNPSTTSTAADLARVGELVMQNPVLSQIVGQPQVSGFPVAGTIKNVNWLLGTNHIIGVKTGNTDQAGGVYVSASRLAVGDQPVTIVTALAGAPTLAAALSDSLPLIQSAQTNFSQVPVVQDGVSVGRYAEPWGGTVEAVTDGGLSLEAWNGTPLTTTVHLRPLPADASQGTVAGSVQTPQSPPATAQSVPVRLQSSLSKPTVWWRLLHP